MRYIAISTVFVNGRRRKERGTSAISGGIRTHYGPAHVRLSHFPYLHGQLGHCATMGRCIIVEHIFAKVTLSHCAIMTKGTMTSDHSATMAYVMWRE
jgi:hypothetical protein